MAKACLICEKGTKMGTKLVLLRGKYNPTKKSRKYPNLQWATLPLQANGKSAGRIKICTDCIKKEKHLTYNK